MWILRNIWFPYIGLAFCVFVQMEPYLMPNPMASYSFTINSSSSSSFSTQHHQQQQYVGFIVDLVDRLSHVIGFDYVIRPVADNSFGHMTPDGRWDGLMAELISGVGQSVSQSCWEDAWFVLISALKTPRYTFLFKSNVQQLFLIHLATGYLREDQVTSRWINQSEHSSPLLGLKLHSWFRQPFRSWVNLYNFLQLYSVSLASAILYGSIGHQNYRN